MSEDATTLTFQIGLDSQRNSEFSGFKPEDKKGVPSLTPTNQLIIFYSVLSI